MFRSQFFQTTTALLCLPVGQLRITCLLVSGQMPSMRLSWLPTVLSGSTELHPYLSLVGETDIAVKGKYVFSIYLVMKYVN